MNSYTKTSFDPSCHELYKNSEITHVDFRAGDGVKLIISNRVTLTGDAWGGRQDLKMLIPLAPVNPFPLKMTLKI